MPLTRRLILQKARHHPTTPPRPKPKGTSRALTGRKHRVSGTISLPSRGTFHHSLTVLIRYRSQGSIQACGVVPADSRQIPRARRYLGKPAQEGGRISATGVTPSTPGRSKPLAYPTAFNSPAGRQTSPAGSLNPRDATPAGCRAPRVWPHPLSLATTRGISSPAGTEMFHFPAFPPPAL